MWAVSGWNRLAVHDEHPVVDVRDEFVTWLGEVPEESRRDLRARLCSGRDDAHFSARLELFIHHFFLSTAWHIQSHPFVPNSTNHPDFLVEKDTSTLLLECRIVQDETYVTQQDERLRKLADAVGRRLNRAVMLHPLSDLPPSIPTNRIARWIDQQRVCDDDIDRLELDYWHEHQGHHYGIRVIVANQKTDAESVAGVHGLVSPVHTIGNGQRLRMALKEKAGKYGSLHLPFVIVISGETKFPLTMRHEQEALFGNRVWEIPPRGPTVVRETRTENGFFRSSAVKHRAVSAVLVYRLRWRSEDHDHRMHMYHNPLALKPIDPGLFPEIPQMVLDGSSTLQWINGRPDDGSSES